MQRISSHLRQTFYRCQDLLAHFAKADRGVAAVEFALVFPLMLSMYVFTVEIGQGLTAQRRVVQIANTVGDLVTQNTNVTNTDLANITTAAQKLLVNFDTTNLKVVITDIVYTSDGKGGFTPSVAWDYPAGSTKTPLNLPASLTPASASDAQVHVIMTTTTYGYVSIFNNTMMTSFLTGGSYAYTLQSVDLHRPRLSDDVTKS